MHCSGCGCCRWRAQYSQTGRRPATYEVRMWYEKYAAVHWPRIIDRPSWKEAHVHAKSLKTKEQARGNSGIYGTSPLLITEPDFV